MAVSHVDGSMFGVACPMQHRPSKLAKPANRPSSILFLLQPFLPPESDATVSRLKAYGSQDSLEVTPNQELQSRRTVQDVEFEVLDDEEEEIVAVKSPSRERQAPPTAGKPPTGLASSIYAPRPYTKLPSQEEDRVQGVQVVPSYTIPSQGGQKVIKPKPQYPDGLPATKPLTDNAARETSKSSEQLSPRGKDLLTKENLANLEARLRLQNIASSPEASPSNVRKSPAKSGGDGRGPSGKPPVPLPKTRPVSATEKTLKAKPAPPKPEDNSKDPDPKPKNSVWYEYGCV